MIRKLIELSRCNASAFLFLAVAIVTAGLHACSEPPPGDTLRLTGATMGTRYNITWLDAEGQPAPEAIHSGVEEVLKRINGSMSTWREDALITRLNSAPAGEWMTVDEEFAAVFAMAREVSEATGGAYDVTVGPLVDLWGFGPRMGDEVPSDEAIAESMSRVGQAQIEFDEAVPALRKPADMSLDFSSIAKGFGVDQIAAYLETQGIDRYLVEIGGEIRVKGMSPRGDFWRIAIEKPVAGPRDVQRAVTLIDTAIATSGDYRNYFEADGVRYSHTIDPRTGAPVRHELVSVTVVHPSAAMADAWATALTVLGPEQALFTALQQQLAVYLISRDGDAFKAQSTPEMDQLLVSIE